MKGEKLRVRISKLQEDVPSSFICDMLFGVLGLDISGCEEIIKDKGYIELELDGESLQKLERVGERSSFIRIENLTLQPKVSINKEDIFTNSWALLKENVSFFLSWSVIYLVLILFSILPILGWLVNLLSWAFFYSTVVYISLHYRNSGGLKLSKLWDYMGAGIGISFGSIGLSIVALFIFVVLLIPFGLLGAIADYSAHSELGENFLVSMGVLLILFLIFLAYYLYAIPIIYSKLIRSGVNFTHGFLSVFYPFTPGGLKEAFSRPYIGMATIWLVVLSVVGVLALVSIISIILIPAGFTLICFLLCYTALAVANYTKSYKSSL